MRTFIRHLDLLCVTDLNLWRFGVKQTSKSEFYFACTNRNLRFNIFQVFILSGYKISFIHCVGKIKPTKQHCKTYVNSPSFLYYTPCRNITSGNNIPLNILLQHSKHKRNVFKRKLIFFFGFEY